MGFKFNQFFWGENLMFVPISDENTWKIQTSKTCAWAFVCKWVLNFCDSCKFWVRQDEKFSVIEIDWAWDGSNFVLCIFAISDCKCSEWREACSGGDNFCPVVKKARRRLLQRRNGVHFGWDSSNKDASCKFSLHWFGLLVKCLHSSYYTFYSQIIDFLRVFLNAAIYFFFRRFLTKSLISIWWWISNAQKTACWKKIYELETFLIIVII